MDAKMIKKKILIIGIASITILLLGLALLFLGEALPGAEKHFRNNCTETIKAKVVGYSSKNAGENAIYTPLFEFDFNGEKYLAKMDTYESDYKEKFVEDQIYTIKINPDNPNEIRLPSSPATFLGVYLLEITITGAILVGLSFLGFIIVIINALRLTKQKSTKI